MKARSLLVFVVAMLPAGGLKNRALRCLGWSIGQDVRISPSFVLGVSEVDIANNVQIGPFNVIRQLARFEVREHVLIGQLNWFSASTHMRLAGAPATLVMKPHSAITNRHYLDCTGGIHVGAYTTVAGVRSSFLTHGISWRTSDQTYSPIEVGDFCLLSSNLQVAPGTTIGDRIVIGMGATVAGPLSEAGLYVQPRAELVKHDLPGDYFERTLGRIDSVRGR